ncbi:hypothetical protein OA520_04450 [Candidatus Pelagibacter sp.]|nr:hypothetical protein [Candidatus Pelagibacter sp.]
MKIKMGGEAELVPGNDLEVVDEHDLLSKLIETSASKDKPILVNNSENNTIGVISQSRLLKAVIEGGDGE